jgi:hypothetical protein
MEAGMSDPLPLAEIYDQLRIGTVEWSAQRNDELSMSGAGEVFQAELAEPLWTAPVGLASREFFHLKRAAALIRSLRGSQQQFLMCDPQAPWPQADPGGVQLGNATVTVRSISADRTLALLQGLPAGYVLTAGDKIQIVYGTSPNLQYVFVEVSRDVNASSGGNVDVRVFPWLPFGLPVGAPVTLLRPACAVVVVKDSHRAGTTRGFTTDSAGFSVIQRRRRS